MKLLVTGGAGYIGSHVAMALARAGHTPIVLDSLVSGYQAAVKHGPFVQGDIGNADVVRHVCETYKPEAVLHFAAFIEVGESVKNPKKYIENNYEKARVLFDTVCDCGVKKAVFSSTAAVYGVPQSDAPIKETHPQKPINPYGESKLLAENYMRSLEEKGLRSVALRYFNAAGAAPLQEELGEAHNPETHLIPNILRSALGYGGEALKIFGTDYETRDGSAVRDYIHILDLASAHIAALDYLAGDVESDIFNLGTREGSSVLEVVKAAEKALKKEVPKELHPRREGDPAVLVADNSKVKEKLGWQARYSLDEIISSALAWHQSAIYRDRFNKGEVHDA